MSDEDPPSLEFDRVLPRQVRVVVAREKGDRGAGSREEIQHLPAPLRRALRDPVAAGVERVAVEDDRRGPLEQRAQLAELAHAA